jgi:hypothetical protein
MQKCCTQICDAKTYSPGSVPKRHTPGDIRKRYTPGAVQKKLHTKMRARKATLLGASTQPPSWVLSRKAAFKDAGRKASVQDGVGATQTSLLLHKWQPGLTVHPPSIVIAPQVAARVCVDPSHRCRSTCGSWGQTSTTTSHPGCSPSWG